MEKRSKFMGKIRPVESEEAARAFVDEMKKKYHDARHNCWCYALRNGVMRYSDDGEPQGTAGQPMLEVFSREGVTNAVCVVTRYFGGVLLGAGPLLRAYQGTAKLALAAAGISVVRRWMELTIPCGYSLLGKITQEIPVWDGPGHGVRRRRGDQSPAAGGKRGGLCQAGPGFDRRHGTDRRDRGNPESGSGVRIK